MTKQLMACTHTHTHTCTHTHTHNVFHGAARYYVYFWTSEKKKGYIIIKMLLANVSKSDFTDIIEIFPDRSTLTPNCSHEWTAYK